MTEQQQLKYYTDRIFIHMAYIEKMLGQLFHESHPDTEQAFWAAVDTKNKARLMYIHAHLCKEVDRLNEVIEQA